MRYLVTGKPNRAAKNVDLFCEMDRMMNSFFPNIGKGESRMPTVDIREEEDRYLLEAELPGYSEDDLSLKVEGNLLTLEANRKAKEDEEEPNYLVRERSTVSYTRSFVLPRSADAAGITASMKNGVLTLELKKHEADKPRTIEIKAE